MLPRVAAQADGPAKNDAKVGLDLLLSAPILRNLLFFFCLAMANGGIQTFTVVSLGAIYGTSAEVANIGLSGFLLFSAAGVLLGGIIADRTPHHERVAAIGFACTSTMAILLAWVNMPAAILIFVMSLGGLLNGVIQPSRDMMVRAVTPAGSFGKVFGFVTTGFNLGGMVSPLIYAWLMDHGQPRAIYAIVVLFILLALVTAMTRGKPKASRMDALTPRNARKKDALGRRYGAPCRRRPWNEAIAAMLDHRSVRGFLPDPVPPGTLETMIAAAQSAATSSNMQRWSAIAVNDPGQEGAGRDRRQPEAYRAMPALHRLGRRPDPQRTAGGREKADLETMPWLETFLVACIDAALAAQNAVVAAQSLGLARSISAPCATIRCAWPSCSACRRALSWCSASASATPTRKARTRSSRACRNPSCCITSATTRRRRRRPSRPTTRKCRNSPPATRCRPRPGPNGC